MDFKIEILTLYKYFAYAAHMRSLYIEEIDPEWLNNVTPDILGMMMLFNSAPGIYLLYSYSGIYLVIEGWRDLGLEDPKIDELLQSPFVDRLRLFRNATFHYQKEPLSWKHLQFFGTEEEQTEVWLNKLYREFARFFGENTLPLPDRLRKSLEGKSSAGIAQTIHEYWDEQHRNGNEPSLT
jgi:hypothetical protein